MRVVPAIRTGGLVVVMISSIATVAPVTYETALLDAKQFMIGKDGGLQVMFHPLRGPEEIGAYLSIVNGTPEPIDVFPQRVRVEAISVSRKGESRSRLRTYHPAQYERMLRRRNWRTGSINMDTPVSTRGGLPGAPAGALYPPSTRETACHAGNQQACGFQPLLGQRFPNLKWLTAPGESPATSLATLLRPRQLAPGESIEGVVIANYRPAGSYHIKIPLAGADFEFDFELPSAVELE